MSTLSSKLQGERYRLTFDFRNDLDFDESISSSFVDVSVQVGVDLSPLQILFDTSAIVGKTVEQVVVLGEPGVIYSVLCTITSSAGQTYQQAQVVAVLTSPLLVPPLIGVRYSSRPYPVNVIESIDYSMQFVSGEFTQLFIPYEYQEAIDHATSFISGELRDLIQVTTMLPEGIDYSTSLLSGELKDLPLYSFSEGMNHSMQIQTGELKDNIRYSDWPAEGIDHSTSVLSGILA